MTDKKTRDEEVAQARRYMAMPLTKAAMDRARGHWVPWLIEALDEAEAERDALKAKLEALVEATIAMRDANIMANDYEWMSCREIDAKYGRVISLTDVANASSDARMKVDAALASAKVQP